MGDYGKLSNFNSKANFSMVRFGADTPITECELNEVQQIQDYKHKQLAKVIGDRFTKVGTMELVEPLEGEENTKLSLVNSDVIVEGNPIHIDQLSTLIKEGQTAYLKVSEKDIDKDSNIKSYGNEQSEETEDNTLLDPRLEGIETARRKQICYDLDVQNTLATHPKQTVGGELELNATKGDYIDNIAIEGETLVNLVDFDVSRANSDGITIRTYFKSANRVSNGTYTLFNNNDKEMFFVTSKISTNEYVEGYTVLPNTPYLLELDSDRQCYGIDFGVTSVGWVDDASWYTHSNVKAIILEGDHTDKPISYFEGLKSVGQGDSIDIINFVKEGESLYDRSYDDSLIMDEYIEQNPNHQNFGTIVSNNKMCRSDEFIEVKPNTVYVLPYANGNVTQYDSSKEILRVEDSVKYLTGGFTKNISIVELRTSPETCYIKVAMEKVHIGKVEIYESANNSLSEISTTVRSLPNGVKDTIEKRGNKYVKVQRCGEVVLDSTLSWSNGNQQTNTRAFRCDTFPTLKAKPLSSLYCDRFKGKMVEGELQEDSEFIYCNTSGSGVKFFVRMTTSTLGSSDVESFKTWLKTNPITVVYELEEPIMEELPNFNPELFEGENTIILNSGVIQKDMNFNYYEYLVPVFEEDTTYIPLIQIHQGKVKDLRITDPNRVNYKMEGKDNSNGQFTKVIQTRQNGTIKRISELSEKVGDNYTKLTVQDYDDLGTTVILTEVYALDYDNEGDLIGQELIERC